MEKDENTIERRKYVGIMNPEEQDKLLLDLKQMLVDNMEMKEAKQEIASQSLATLTQVQNCISFMKRQMGDMQADHKEFQATIKMEHKGFSDAFTLRIAGCDKIHDDVEERLRNTGDCGANVRRIGAMEHKMDKVTPFMYKVTGAVFVIAIVVPPAVSAMVAFVMKKLTTPGP